MIPQTIPSKVPSIVPAIWPNNADIPQNGLVERYNFAVGQPSAQSWTNLAPFARTCTRGSTAGSDTNDPTLSAIGASFDGVDDYCLPGYIYPLLAGATAVTDMYLVKPSALVTTVNRNMIADRICAGVTTSGITAWFINSGKLLAGARVKSTDVFANVSMTSANPLSEVGKWSLVASEFDFVAKTIKFYLNGVFTGDLKTGCGWTENAVVNESPTDGADKFGINAGKSPNYYFAGLMLESVTYNRVLTTLEHAQVAAYYVSVLKALGETTW